MTTDEEIQFYSKNWTLLQTAAHQFHDLSAISFDEVQDIIYFTDTNNKLANIFSLKVYEDDHFNYKINELVKKQLDEEILGVAYDPVENVLYWSDTKNRQIHRWNLNDTKNKDTVWMTFGGEIPRGIAVDFCNRKLYWTNINQDLPTIERASLEDPSDREVLVKEGIRSPLAVIVDSFNDRFYWTDYSRGSSYKVESLSLNGTDKTTLVRGTSKKPFGLMVDDDSIYFTDEVDRKIIQINKVTNQRAIVASIKDHIPRGIITKNNFALRDHVNTKCQNAVKSIKERIEVEKIKEQKHDTDYCLNGGSEISGDIKKCKCLEGFSGARCEVDMCKNYCLNGGSCFVKNGTAICQKCDIGFTGTRCEKDVCQGFCMNGGTCDLYEGKPICTSCPLRYSGERCENTRSKREVICKEICADSEMDEDLKPICER